MAEANRILSILDRRVPQWDMKALVDRACPFCESNGQQVAIRPDALTVLSCATCGALYVSPCPSESHLSVFYQTYHQKHRASAFKNRRSLLRQIKLLRPQDDYRIMELTSMMKTHGARVLDLGCGLGQYLYIFRQLGAEVHGVDLDPDAVSFIKNELGIDTVRCGSVDALETEPLYDLVILHDLVEHPLLPFDILQKCSRLLRDGGLLFVWTPNATFALEEDEPTILRVDLEHMQYMNVRTVRYVSERLGLDIVHLENVGFMSRSEIEASKRKASLIFQLTCTVKSIIRSLPGFPYAISVRNALFQRPNERLGNYHLFVIMKKAAGGMK